MTQDRIRLAIGRAGDPQIAAGAILELFHDAQGVVIHHPARVAAVSTIDRVLQVNKLVRSKFGCTGRGDTESRFGNNAAGLRNAITGRAMRVDRTREPLAEYSREKARQVERRI